MSFAWREKRSCEQGAMLNGDSMARISIEAVLIASVDLSLRSGAVTADLKDTSALNNRRSNHHAHGDAAGMLLKRHVPRH